MTSIRKKLVILYANSSFAYVLAYLSIFIPTQILVYFVARGFNIPTKFNYFKLIFPIADHSFLWTQLSVSAIYAASPLVALFSIVFVLRYYLKHAGKRGTVTNLYFIWLYAHCVNIFFGGLLIGIPLIKDFGYLPNWLYASNDTIVYLILISALFLLVNGIFLRKAFTSLCFDEKFFNSPYHSLVFKAYIAFFPALTCMFFFIVFNFPDDTIFTKLLHVIVLVQLCTVVPHTSMHIPILDRFRNFSLSYKSVFTIIILLMLFTSWKLIHNIYFN
jgi:hypothetical protein